MQEERRRKKEEDDQNRRAARALKMAEFEKWKNPPKANFVISKKLAGEEGAEVINNNNSRICKAPYAKLQRR